MEGDDEVIEEIRKLITSILWDIADIIDFVASEIVCPPTSYEKQERHPEPQYPVGTIWYNRVGDAWRVESNGEWHQVEQDGEPLEPIEERMSKAYEGILPEDDDETSTSPITFEQAALRTRIVAALARADQDWCSDNNLHEDMADAVIRELDNMGIVE